jgi:two-component system, OmpR family, sensor kinase
VKLYRSFRHGEHGHHYRHDPYCDVPRRSRLQRRLFLWFGATIACTGLAVGVVVGLFGPGGSHFREDFARVEALAGAEFARAWLRPAERRALSENIARAFRADVTLTDLDGRVLESVGKPCVDGTYTLAVRGPEGPLGYVHGCLEKRRYSPRHLWLALVAAVGVLWAAAGLIARRLTRPLGELVRVTQAIGGGNLAARVRLGRHQAGEVGALADSVNEMAARIERQLREERALLAAVSHELRSPLARLRVLVELARSSSSAERLDEIEREIVGIDALIGKLLASSRLEFGELRLETLTAAEVAARALEVGGFSSTLLADASGGALVEVDPTLVGRALGNLLENAGQHAGGVTALAIRVTDTGGSRCVRFEIDDQGPGFAKETLERAFEAFYSARSSDNRKESGSLGLGLNLVARIARAHGGRAYAENRVGGGARAVLELPLAESP